MIKEEQLECLELLIENELAVACLYEAYAQKTEGKEEFWQQLAKEEVLHSEWVAKLGEKIESGEVIFKEHKVPKEEVREEIRRTKEEAEKVSHTGIIYLSHKQELENALEKESGMIEKKFFKLFKTDNTEVKEVLEKLEAETKMHRERLEEELKEEKSK